MIIALIGSPLSGKTSLLKKLKERGINIFSADVFINEIYKKNKQGYNLIKNTLGFEFVNEDAVNRRKLAEWCVENDNLQKLNSLIHPLIFDYLDKKDNFVAELPIISTSNIKFNYDKLVFVYASKNVLVERFIKRKVKNPNFVKKIIDDWYDLKIEFDLKVDTTNGISDEIVKEILNLFNE